MKGKNPERWLTYVLDHVKGTKDEDMYRLLPEFGKTLTESTNIFIDTGEHLADGNIHHKAKGHRLIV